MQDMDTAKKMYEDNLLPASSKVLQPVHETLLKAREQLQEIASGQLQQILSMKDRPKSYDEKDLKKLEEDIRLCNALLFSLRTNNKYCTERW